MRFALTILALFPTYALAGSDVSDLFACTFQNGGKAVVIDLSGDTVRYRFGRPGSTPELEVLHNVRQTGMRPWSGVGSSIWDELWVRNGDVTYLVSAWSDRRVGEDNSLNATLQVLKGDERLAELQCDPGSARGDINLLFDAKEKAGQTWCHQSFSWTDGACDG